MDAKAWALEENLQKLLVQCLQERETQPATSTAQTIAGSNTSTAGDLTATSAATSVNGAVLDHALHDSPSAADSPLMQRRQLYANLRHNLFQLMMPMDEKNHVLNNANEDISRHIRRQDDIWVHLSDEISEDTRLGSLKHWALTDLNPTKKSQAAAARGRDAAASLTMLHDTDVAERSERRREAILAKKQKVAQHADSDMEDRLVARKGAAGNKGKRLGDLAPEPVVLAKGKGKKVEKTLAGATTMERQGSRSGMGGAAMSREPSQQDNVKKRKAPTSASTVARKRCVGSLETQFVLADLNRLNVNTQESPKLASSPLAAGFGKDAYKKSPALSVARPATARGRQSSAQGVDNTANRPSSSSRRNANGLAVETNNVIRISRDADGLGNGEFVGRGGASMQRTASKQSNLKREALLSDERSRRGTASPRLAPALLAETKPERNGKGKGSKTSTPLVGSFAEADLGEMADGWANDPNAPLVTKIKRPSRPRMKDHHGLHDSLSPQGLPTKRTHKKNGSYSLSASQSMSSRVNEDRLHERKPSGSSRTNSRSTKVDKDRATSHTPRIGSQTELVDEPDSMVDDMPSQSMSRKASAKGSQGLELLNASQSTHQDDSNDGLAPDELEGQEIFEDLADGEVLGDEEVDDDDPEEQRYCYCNGVSYGEMVACDNEDCPKEWFHLACIGMKHLPKAATTWYCDFCRPKFGKA